MNETAELVLWLGAAVLLVTAAAMVDLELTTVVLSFLAGAAFVTAMWRTSLLGRVGA